MHCGYVTRLSLIDSQKPLPIAVGDGGRAPWRISRANKGMQGAAPQRTVETTASIHVRRIVGLRVDQMCAYADLSIMLASSLPCLVLVGDVM
jgi:hypothetical protein